MREGLPCFLSSNLREPQFSSQTKDQLVSSCLRDSVRAIVAKRLYA